MSIGAWYRSFWQGPEVSAVQLSRFRLIFFALLAYDAFLIVGSASRYGFGGFNVPHFPSLTPITPMFDRVAIVVCALVCCYLAARVAIGGFSRIMVVALALIYSAIYFSSQLDSFQHHYLLVLMLFAFCLIDWSADKQSGPGLRLILLQVSVVYFFAAISKMEAGWWNGEALEAMFRNQPPSAVGDLMGSIGFKSAARLIALTELFLAFAIHVRVVRVPVALAGIGLHGGIIFAGESFEIGLFSYYMLAFYMLVLPPGLFRWSAIRAPSWLGKKASGLGNGPRWLPAALAGVVAFAIIAFLIPLDGAVTAAIVVSVFAFTKVPTKALAHLLAVLAVLGCAWHSDAIRDHYRFWGGSARRAGDTETATRAYKRLTEVEPDYAPGRRNLGRMLLAAGDAKAALGHYKAAAALDPDAVASHLGLAQTYAKLGQGPEALHHAKKTRELAAADPKATSRAMKQAARQATVIERRFSGAL